MSNLYPNLVVASGDSFCNNQVIGKRNRVINGAMRIDQRNVGASVSVATSSSAYIIDRFSVVNNLSNAITSQQVVLGASGAPLKLPMTSTANHTHALLWTNSSTATTSNTVTAYIQTLIEANTCVDFGWGNSSPRTVTLSFWVYCSVPGTYSASLFPSGSGNASYTTVYTISAASTWQQIKVTIPGPTFGTWTTDTAPLTGMIWALHGSGASNATSTLGAWTTTTGLVSTTQTNLGTTASSTFALTGVQLELGTLATPFEWRSWETEMRMCQRYYEKSYDYAIVKGSNVSSGSTMNAGIVWVFAVNASNLSHVEFKVEKRVIPNFVAYNSGGTANSVYAGGGTSAVAITGYPFSSTKRIGGLNSNGNFTQGSFYYLNWDANADY